MVDSILAYLGNLGPLAVYILSGLGSLVVLGAAYIKLTPKQDDDQWLQSLENKPLVGDVLKALIKFSPISRKE